MIYWRQTYNHLNTIVIHIGTYRNIYMEELAPKQILSQLKVNEITQGYVLSY